MLFLLIKLTEAIIAKLEVFKYRTVSIYLNSWILGIFVEQHRNIALALFSVMCLDLKFRVLFLD